MTVFYKKRLVELLLSTTLMSAATVFADQVADYKAYCLEAGGAVEKMTAEISTGSGTVRGQSKMFCNFAPDNGFLSIGLETFSADEPSIAATYIKNLGEITDGSPLLKGSYSNPSANVCKNIGGAMIGFVASGGFANQLGQSDICIFGDGSMVSAWSLVYMANHRTGYDEVKHKVKAEPLNIYTH